MSTSLNSDYSASRPLMALEVVSQDKDSRLFECIKPHLTLKDFTYSQIKYSKKALALKTLMGLGGLLGRIPLIPVSSGFEPQIKGLGPAMAATNFVALGSFFVWASSHIVNQVRAKLALSETGPSSSGSKLKTISLLGFNIINGFVSLIPGLVVAWDYNQSRPYMVVFSILDVTSPIYSLQLLSFEILQRLSNKPIEKKIKSIQAKLGDKLSLMIEKIIKNDPFYLIEIFKNMDTFACSEDKFIKLLDTDLEPEQKVLKKGLLEKSLAFTLATFLIGVQLTGLGVISAEGISNLTDNKLALVAASVYVVVCNMFLTSLLLKQSSEKAVENIFNVFRGRFENRYISESLIPTIAKITQVFALMICLTTFVPAAQVAKDHLEANLFWPATIGYGLGFVLMDYSPFRDLLDDVSGYMIHHFGHGDKKTRYHVYKQLVEIRSLIWESDPKAFSKFILKFAHHKQIAAYLESETLSQEQIHSYVYNEPYPDFDNVV